MNKKRSYQGNPQKNSPALGATLAFLGINGILALLHGSQGCSTWIRLQLSRHFKEPIPLNSTALLEDTAIFGGWEHLKKGIAKAADKYNPQIIGVMSSGLTETFGDDMASALESLRQERPDLRELPVVLASTPDYIGSMQEGYQRTVLALISTLISSDSFSLTRSFSAFESDTIAQEIPVIAVFPGCHLSPADVDELKDIIKLFGFRPITVPDLSTSLDGHAELEPAPVVQGGTDLREISYLPRSVATFSLGLSMKKAGELLNSKYNIPHFHFSSATGLAATDSLILTLAKLSKKEIPSKLLRQRSQLLDTLADYHDQLGGKRVALALETDLLYSLATSFEEVGAQISLALAASQGEIKCFPDTIPVEVGDLEELEARASGSHLIIANSNGRQAASPLKLPHLRAGLPVFDQAGYPQKVWVGYRGTQQFFFDALNTMVS
ncbi:MAG: nitrogenase iron-molybdenum cofactor biosynthesis protein NifN [Desulfitobacterium hafniense]|nr:nitrogenase iron-molybdenum cofactor biosynthesis protein NifN [Desulfitobacterium hafniense]